jgi:hypothetical protein
MPCRLRFFQLVSSSAIHGATKRPCKIQRCSTGPSVIVIRSIAFPLHTERNAHTMPMCRGAASVPEALMEMRDRKSGASISIQRANAPLPLSRQLLITWQQITA